MDVTNDIKKLPTTQVVLVIVFLGIAWALMHFQIFAREPLPTSLKSAGLTQGKMWSERELNLATKVTRKVLQMANGALTEADNKGDARAAIALFDPLTEVLSAWNDQQAYGLSINRDCILAAAQLADGVDSVAKGGRYTNKDRFVAALKGCDA